MSMTTKFEEAVNTLADFQARANLAASTMRINCTCSEPEYRKDCPWYRDWRKLAAEAAAYGKLVDATFPASEARAIEIRATAIANEPSFRA